MKLHAPALVVTDLDGTLFNRYSRAAACDLEALEALRGQGIVRLIATGRSLYSARHVLAPEFPVDYLAFSTGAAVMDWTRGEILVSHAIPGELAGRAAAGLIRVGVNFMVHRPVPENHRFAYHESRPEATDFRRRIEAYEPYGERWDALPGEFGEASQLLAVIPPDPGLLETIRARLDQGLRAVRTTSPMDGHSMWVEIFPEAVSKASAAAWVAAAHGIPRERTFALGNDYNDLDMLEWAGASMVTANAPAELRERFAVAPSNDEGGFSGALRAWGLL